MKKALLPCVSLFCFTVTAIAAFADAAPAALSDMPLYAGATRDPAGEKGLLTQSKNWATDKNFVSVDVREYVVNVLIEDVFPWYAKKFGLSLDTHEGPGPDPDDLYAGTKPGTASRMTWYVQEDEFNDAHYSMGGDEGGAQDANSEAANDAFVFKMEKLDQFRKQTYETKRKKLLGLWARSAIFEWKYIDKNKQLILFRLEIVDASFDDWTETNPAYKPKSRIELEAFVSKAPDLSVNAQKAQEAKKQQEAAAKADAQRKADESKGQSALMASLPAGEPKADFLEVPVYPGAVYSKDLSDAFHARGQASFYWSVADAPAKVAAYYEKALGVKANPMQSSFQLEKVGKNRVTIMIADNKVLKMASTATELIITLAPLNGGSTPTAATPPATASPQAQTTAPSTSSGTQAAAASTQSAASAGQGSNPLIGTWVGSWTLQTTTYTYTFYTYNPDGSYSFAGTFKESQSGVSGTFNGSGTYTVDQAAGTYTTNGNYVQKPTDGPAAYFPYFVANLSGPSTWTFTVSGATLVSTQTVNGVTSKIALAKK